MPTCHSRGNARRVPRIAHRMRPPPLPLHVAPRCPGAVLVRVRRHEAERLRCTRDLSRRLVRSRRCSRNHAVAFTRLVRTHCHRLKRAAEHRAIKRCRGPCLTHFSLVQRQRRQKPRERLGARVRLRLRMAHAKHKRRSVPISIRRVVRPRRRLRRLGSCDCQRPADHTCSSWICRSQLRCINRKPRGVGQPAQKAHVAGR